MPRLFQRAECSLTTDLVFSAVPCSNDNVCLSLFMITPGDFVCCASELELSRI